MRVYLPGIYVIMAPPPPNNRPPQPSSKPLIFRLDRRVPVKSADENRPRPTQFRRGREGGTSTNTTAFLPPPPPPLNRQVQSQNDVRFPTPVGGTHLNAGRVNLNHGFGVHHPLAPGLDRRMSVDNYLVIGGTNTGTNENRAGAGSAPPRTSRLSTGPESVSAPGGNAMSGTREAQHVARPASASQAKRTNSDPASSLSTRASFYENRNDNANTSRAAPSISHAQTTPLFLADEPRRDEPPRERDSQSYDNMDAETLWRHNHRHLLRYLPFPPDMEAGARGGIVPIPNPADAPAANRGPYVNYPGFRDPNPHNQPPSHPSNTPLSSESHSFNSIPSSSSPNPSYNYRSHHLSDLFHADFQFILSETEKMHEVVTDFYAKKKIWLAEQMVKEEGNARKLREEMNVWSWRLSHAKAAFGYLHQRKVCRESAR